METVFSGIQPTGELHLGNYLGAVRNWVALQGRYECFFCIVDYHAITQTYQPEDMAKRVRAMAVDLLACGLDPERMTLFVQSNKPKHTERAGARAAGAPRGGRGRGARGGDEAARRPENSNA